MCVREREREREREKYHDSMREREMEREPTGESEESDPCSQRWRAYNRPQTLQYTGKMGLSATMVAGKHRFLNHPSPSPLAR